MTRRAFSIDDLPADVRAKVESQTRSGVDLDRMTQTRKRKTRAPRDESAIARKRKHTGDTLEHELDLTHRQYEFEKVGKIWPHSPPFVCVKGKWMHKAGGAPVDRTGHVCVVRGIDRTPLGSLWRSSPVGDVIPVAFDAKVLGDKHATYQHDTKSQHQLHQLREAARAGVAAFLLVHAKTVDMVFMLPIENHFDDLISGRGVTLFERERSANHPINTIKTHLPAISRGAPKTWDWVPLLRWYPFDR